MRIGENPDADRRTTGSRGKEREVTTTRRATVPRVLLVLCVIRSLRERAGARIAVELSLSSVRSGKSFAEEEDWKSSRKSEEDGGTDGRRDGQAAGGRSATANKSGPENCPSGKTRAWKLTAAAEGTRTALGLSTVRQARPMEKEKENEERRLIDFPEEMKEEGEWSGSAVGRERDLPGGVKNGVPS